MRTQSGFEIVFRLIGDQTQRTQVTVTGNAGPRLLSVSFVSKILHLYFSLPLLAALSALIKIFMGPARAVSH